MRNKCCRLIKTYFVTQLLVLHVRKAKLEKSSIFEKFCFSLHLECYFAELHVKLID